MKQLLLFCFTLSCVVLQAQLHCVKLNSTFVVTNKPVGGFGYEYAPDSSLHSLGISAEVGRYSNSSIGTVNSSIDYYTLFGVGLMPEFRHYIGGNGWYAPRGWFVTAFSRTRFLELSKQFGVSTTPGGYQLDSPSTELTHGFSFDYGLGVGFKTGKSVRGLHVEGVVGYAISHCRLYENAQHREEVIRFDLSLSGILQKSHPVNPEFTW